MAWSLKWGSRRQGLSASIWMILIKKKPETTFFNTPLGIFIVLPTLAKRSLDNYFNVIADAKIEVRTEDKSMQHLHFQCKFYRF